VKILLIDNYDSFTYNLEHYLIKAGAEVVVVRNDALSEFDMTMNAYHAAVLSPGPGEPIQAGMLMQFVAKNVGVKPLLGVCLGMQALGLYYQWELETGRMPMHGKSSIIQHSAKGIFRDLPNPMRVGRYHSLIIKSGKNGHSLQTEATCDEEIMAVSCERDKVWAVQFHPESILTPDGQELIVHWIDWIAANP
jgi:para-aminobenzoate synthetase component II